MYCKYCSKSMQNVTGYICPYCGRDNASDVVAVQPCVLCYAKDAEIERLKAKLLKQKQEYNHMQRVLSLRNGWQEAEKLEAVVQELAEQVMKLEASWGQGYRRTFQIIEQATKRAKEKQDD